MNFQTDVKRVLNKIIDIIVINEKIDNYDRYADTTKRGYKAGLKIIYKQFGNDIFKKECIDKIIEGINERYSNVASRAERFNTLFALTEYDEYFNEAKKNYNEKDKLRIDNILTKKELENWISLDDLKNIPNILKKKIEDDYGQLWIIYWPDFYDLKKKRSQKYVKDIMDYIILMIHTYHPLRLDYREMKFKKEGDQLSDNENFILIKNDSMELHMNNYKNSASYNETNIQILSPEICDCITNWIKVFFNVSGFSQKIPNYLICKVKPNLNLDDPYDNGTTFSNKISTLFEKYSGKHLTVTIIRKIHESELMQSPEYAQMTNREKEVLHQKLLHTQKTAMTSYNKIKRDL